MNEYWGLKAIAQKMNWKYERTPIRQALSSGFPIFRRRRRGRLLWYSNEGLIHAWELKRCQLDREMLVERVRARSNRISPTLESNIVNG